MPKEISNINEAPVRDITRGLDMAAGRRAFVQALGFGAIGSVLFGAAAGTATYAEAQAVTDFDILNFALNLEYLESTFYHYAAFGTDIPAGNTDGSGTPGQVTGGAMVPFNGTSIVKAYATEIATEELKHVQVLRAVLGSAKVSRPAINIGIAFGQAAQAAGISGGAAFNPYASETDFLIGSYIFEDVGVTAYHGAAGLISNKTYLNYAAGILAVEAYHAGIIRTALFALQNSTILTNLAQISALRSKLSTGSPNVDDLGVGTLKFPSLVPVDAAAATMFTDLPGGDAIAYARTTTEVLNIVYGDSTRTNKPGLFFPSGMNGTIR